MRNLSKLMRLFNIALMNTLYNISNKVTQSIHKLAFLCVCISCRNISIRMYIHVKINFVPFRRRKEGRNKTRNRHVCRLRFHFPAI